MTTAPRLFISYSWSNPTHEQWVVDLATELRSSGVDVILDKWDLREGHDALAFMEKMISDASITKVIIVCDKIYVSKADGRAGGVGTETQIISPEIYAKQAQDKFVAVIAERDENGKPYLPIYYKSRIYVDLSEAERYSENFEKLLRWIFDKPLFVKPELGKAPAFIVEPNAIALGTSVLAKRAIEGVKNGKEYARGAVEEYLNVFSENLERYRMGSDGGEPDEQIVKSIEEFTPARNEYIQVLTTLTQYTDVREYMSAIHRFFESLVCYFLPPKDVSSYTNIDFDNFKFIAHELFLYTLAVLIRAEKLDAATYLLSQQYYVADTQRYSNEPILNFSCLHEHTQSLDIRNSRLKLRLLSLRATLLEERSKSSSVQFRHLMQADFVCFIRAAIRGFYWWPETLLYATRQHNAFEIFARSASNSYLSKVLLLIGVTDIAILKARVAELAANNQARMPRWEYNSFSLSILMGLEQLGTRE